LAFRRAFARTISFRMMAVRATFAGFPALVSSLYSASMSAVDAEGEVLDALVQSKRNKGHRKIRTATPASPEMLRSRMLWTAIQAVTEAVAIEG
jgi:hypothetical protein